MKVFAGGIITETNTFSPVPTGFDDYIFGQGDAVMETAPAECQILSRLGQCTGLAGWTFCPSFIAVAEPGGITTRLAYEKLRSLLLDDLKQAMPVDMVLLPLHGAMVADGYDDCEGDIITHVREVVGKDVAIGVELDLHCHLTQAMIEGADLIAIYREYPHTDILDRAEDLFHMTADKALGKTRPVMAMYDCRMINLYPTAHQPMRSIVDHLQVIEQRPGIIAANIGHGFPWGDVADCGTRTVVISDGDRALAEATAKELGQLLFDNRHELQMISLGLEDAFGQAETFAAENTMPVVIADQSDNAGGGAASDSTFALEAMLTRGLSNAAIGMIWDPQVVEIAMKVDVGSHLKVRLGGKTSTCSGQPLDLEVIVRSKQKEFVQPFPQGEDDAISVPCGDTVCLECDGIYIIVNSVRTQVFHPHVFTGLGLDISKLDILVVKSIFHFYAGFAPVASEVLLMGAPGALNTRFSEIPYKKVSLNKFPWRDNPFVLSA